MVAALKMSYMFLKLCCYGCCTEDELYGTVDELYVGHR